MCLRHSVSFATEANIIHNIDTHQVNAVHLEQYIIQSARAFTRVTTSKSRLCVRCRNLETLIAVGRLLFPTSITSTT